MINGWMQALAGGTLHTRSALGWQLVEMLGVGCIGQFQGGTYEVEDYIAGPFGSSAFHGVTLRAVGPRRDGFGGGEAGTGRNGSSGSRLEGSWAHSYTKINEGHFTIHIGVG